ncbi:MAG: sulfotransferase [Candidatus Omnitrophica bacterium]|nr:sulfotransferase [Candidatus Omnitrophota bacterium]
MAEYNLKSIGSDRYKVIRFEDLTANCPEVMRELAEFTGLEYDKNLMEPTILGYPWKGNNFQGKKFEKASTVNVNRWKERIPEEDAKLIEFHFADLMQKYNYDLVFNPKDAQKAATNHYKWFNFSTPYSAK